MRKERTKNNKSVWDVREMSEELIRSTANAAIMRYGLKNRLVVGVNVYQYLSQQLGYKANNYLYDVLNGRKAIKLEDLSALIAITGDETLKEEAINYFKRISVV